MRECGGDNSLAPDLALARVQPFHAWADFLEWIASQEFFEDCFYTLLEGAVFGAEAVGDDAFGIGWDAD